MDSESLYDPEKSALLLFDSPSPAAVQQILQLASLLEPAGSEGEHQDPDLKVTFGNLEIIEGVLGSLLRVDYDDFQSDHDEGWTIRYAVTRRIPDMKALEIFSIIRCSHAPGAIAYSSIIERVREDLWALVDHHTETDAEDDLE